MNVNWHSTIQEHLGHNAECFISVGYQLVASGCVWIRQLGTVTPPAGPTSAWTGTTCHEACDGLVIARDAPSRFIRCITLECFPSGLQDVGWRLRLSQLRQGQTPSLIGAVQCAGDSCCRLHWNTRAILRRYVLDVRIPIAFRSGVARSLLEGLEPPLDVRVHARATYHHTLPVGHRCDHSLDMGDVLQVDQGWTIGMEEPWPRRFT
mmetsp:Transcript_54554/g.152174  ORF Transcript_54554/g.152174 Transcript_54554/m.152174 type:complete len:207 (-) Transcript_54554:752-1372(-)